MDELGKHVGNVGLRVDTVHFASLNQRRNTGPIFRTLIVAGEERVFPIQDDGAYASFDDVGIEFDATIVEETGEPLPMTQGIADRFSDQRLARDADKLLLKPGFERQHERLAIVLARCTAGIGTLPRIAFSIA